MAIGLDEKSGKHCLAAARHCAWVAALIFKLRKNKIRILANEILHCKGEFGTPDSLVLLSVICILLIR